MYLKKLQDIVGIPYYLFFHIVTFPFYAFCKSWHKLFNVFLIELSRHLFRPLQDLLFHLLIGLTFFSTYCKSYFKSLGRWKDENLEALSQGGSKCPNQKSPKGPWWRWPCAINTLLSLTTPFVCFELLSLLFVEFYSIVLHLLSPHEAKNQSKLSLFGPKKRMPWFFCPKLKFWTFWQKGNQLSNLTTWIRSFSS